MRARLRMANGQILEFGDLPPRVSPLWEGDMIERNDEGDLVVTLPEHCHICGMLIRGSDIKEKRIAGGLLFSPGEVPFLVHKSCAARGWER